MLLVSVLCAAAVTTVLGAQPVGAAAPVLVATPLTWNVIGLDSNNPATGPHQFPVGARVCNTGTAAASDVAASFVWDSANAYVNLSAGSLSTIQLGVIAPGGCADAYFEVDVQQTSSAFDTTRRYHVTATDSGSGVAAATPQPRELYVEHLISQNRNGVDSVKLNGSSIPAGGAMTLSVGNTYTLEVAGHTATQGYEQLESFINLPNTVFQILAVNTTYSANTSIVVSSPSDKLYADACGWDDQPNSPNYRSCVGAAGKAGGTVVTTYTIKIVSGAGTSRSLGSLFYDFSGSSFHYNSDFGVAGRIATIVDLGDQTTFAKAFSPSATTAGGTSTITFTMTNTSSVAQSGANFTDTLPSSPAQMVVATPATFSTSGCGTATFAPVAGASSVTFSSGTIPATGTCTASVRVGVPSAPTNGTYTNTSNNLFIGSHDTGHSATANLALTSSTAGSGLCGVTFARWNFATGFATATPAPTVANVTASASAGAGLTPQAGTESTLSNAAGSDAWGTNGSVATGPSLNTANNDYFQFALDTTGASSIALSFDAIFKTPNGPQGIAIYAGTSNTRPETGSAVFTNPNAITAGQNSWQAFGAGNSIQVSSGLNPSGLTYFRIYTYNSGNTNSGSDIFLDNVLFTGCGAAAKPTMTKAFSATAVAVNATSTLTFTLTNPNSAALTGAKFTDPLPSGLQVAATPNASTTCTGSPSWAPTAGATTLNFGQTTGATLPGSGSCTVSVSVQVTTPGPHTNVSGFLTTAESGTSTGPGGSAVASVTALLPPVISKSFGSNPILAGGTSLLTLTISNPNQSNALSGIQFTDNYPLGLTNANPLTPPVSNTCGGTPTATAVGTSLALTGTTLAAGASCTVSVTVTAATQGSYANTSGPASATTAGPGSGSNTATLTVNNVRPAIRLLKEVSTATTGPWRKFTAVAPGTPIYYRFTVENIGDVTLNPFSVSDPTLAGTAADASQCTWSTPNTPSTLPALPAASPVADPTATCVVGPILAATGDNPNAATAHGVYGGSVVDSPESNADVVGAVPGFSLLKQISASANGPWYSAIDVQAGDSVYYRFLLTNTGGVALSGIGITDPTVSTTSCTYVDPLVVGGATRCVVGPVTATGLLDDTTTNTATGQGDNGGTTLETGPSSADYTISLNTATADLAVLKQDGATSVTAGGTTAYTITVKNIGPDDVTDARVEDAAPAGQTIGSWTCIVTDSGTSGDVSTACGQANGTGNINTTVTIARGAVITYTVPTTIALSAQSTLDNIVMVTPPAGVNDPKPANNTATDSDVVNPAAISAVDDSGSAVSSTEGGTSFTNVLANDTFGSLTATTSDVTVTQVSTDHANITVSGTDVVVAPGTPVGTYQLVYRICDKLNPANCDTATVTVPVSPPTIVAADDSGTTVVGTTGGTSLTNVLVNDTLDGVPATTSTVTVTEVFSGHANITLSGTNVIVAPGTPAGTYQFVYRICDQLNPTNCDTATVTVTVSAPVIVAVDDSGATVDGATGGPGFTNVLANDTFDGDPASTATVTVTEVFSDHSNITLSGTDVVVAPGTPAGTYQLVYQICDKLNPGNCDTATVTVTVNVPVTPPVIGAVDDSGTTVDGATGGTSLTNVLVNDTLDGNPATTSTVTVAEVFSGHPNITLSGTDVIVAAGTPAGTYQLVYQICDTVATSNCDIATVTVPVAAPVIVAVDDSGATVNGATGGTSFTNVLVNDTLDGDPAATAGVTVAEVFSGHPNITLSGTDVIVAAGTPAGTYQIVYQICDNLNPTNCDTATVTVPVAAPVILAADDSGATVNGVTGGTSFTSVLVNDTRDGDAATIAGVTVAEVFSGHANITLSGSDVIVAAGTPAGTYQLVYQICDNLNPTNCDIATVTVPVAAPVILAADDSGATVNGVTGDTSFTNVLTADTLDGNPATTATVTVSQVSTEHPNITLSGTDVIVAPETPTGTYQLVYRICDKLNPTNCDTATVTVTISIPSSSAPTTTPPTTTAPTATPPTTTPPAPATPPAPTPPTPATPPLTPLPGQLPATGSYAQSMTGAAAGILCAGMLLAALASRRRQRRLRPC